MKHYVKPVSPWVAFSILMLAFPPCSYGLETGEVHLDASGMERDARLIDLRMDRSGQAIMLDDSELVEDDGPGSGVPEGMDERAKERPWVEDLKKGIAKKKYLCSIIPPLSPPGFFSREPKQKGTVNPSIFL